MKTWTFFNAPHVHLSVFVRSIPLDFVLLSTFMMFSNHAYVRGASPTRYVDTEHPSCTNERSTHNSVCCVVGASIVVAWLIQVILVNAALSYAKSSLHVIINLCLVIGMFIRYVCTFF
jgi:hypothetical protein